MRWRRATCRAAKIQSRYSCQAFKLALASIRAEDPSGPPALRPSADGSGVRPRTSDFSSLCQKAVDRQWSRAPQDEGRKAGEVKEVGFKAGRSELRAGSGHSLELDRAEPVRQMHGKRGDQEDRRHRYTG